MPRSFRILKTLGKGAFGEVLLAEMRSDDDFVQTLAVKWLHEEHSRNPEIAGRLRDEARLLGLLAHPHIVRVQGLTTIDERLAVLMEPIQGVDLNGRKLPPDATRRVIRAAADALDAAWDTVPPGRSEPLRVVHRDIKPSNLMVTPRGEVKVMDFGVARATFEAREVETRSQQYGTARYMAPERWLDGIAEAPSDIYSLGVTLVELVTGEGVPRARLSRQGFDEDLEAILGRLTPVDAGALEPLVRRMLAFDPQTRPSAHEVMDALETIVLPGPGLESWSRTLVVREVGPSPLTGTLMVEDASGSELPHGTSGTMPLTGMLGTEPTPGADAMETVAFDDLPEAIDPAKTTAVPIEARTPEPPTVASTELPNWRRAAPLLLLPILFLLGWAFLPAAVAPRDPTPTRVVAAVPRPPPVAPENEPVRPVVPEPDPLEPPAPQAPAPEPSVPAPPAPEPRAPEPERRPPSTPDVDPPVPEPTPSTPIAFVVDEGVTATTPHGALAPGRQALLLPRGELVRVTGSGPDGDFACTLSVGTAPATWRVRADGKCVQR